MSKNKIRKKFLATLIFSLALLIGFTLILHLLYPLTYRDYINQYSQEYNIDPFLVASIINVESKYDKYAKSAKNARGLMQIGEQTGKWASEELNIEDYNEDLLYGEKLNIQIGTWYLNKLNREFKGNLDLILAAYNGGSGNVSKWLTMEEYSRDGKNLDHIPFGETENYVKKVKLNYRIYKTFYKKQMFKSDKKQSLYIESINRIRNYIKSF